MTAFRDTDAAASFIATAASRETSPEIMHAIAFFARDLSEAEALWNGDGFGRICHASDLWERVTKNGLRNAADYCWGAAGHDWWSAIDDGRDPHARAARIGRLVRRQYGLDDGADLAFEALARHADWSDERLAQHVAQLIEQA